MKLFAITSVLLIVAHAAGCDTAQQPKRSPGVERLGYYLGSWRGEGETKAGPFGPAGKLSSTSTCEWFEGGFQLVCRGEERGPTGKRLFLNIRSYDQASETYTEYSISDRGESEYNTGGSIVGNRRMFVLNSEVDGKPARFRYTEVQVSPTLYTYQAEASVDGAPWTMIAEGRVRKVK